MRIGVLIGWRCDVTTQPGVTRTTTKANREPNTAKQVRIRI